MNFVSKNLDSYIFSIFKSRLCTSVLELFVIVASAICLLLPFVPSRYIGSHDCFPYEFLMVGKHRLLNSMDFSEFSKIQCNWLIQCAVVGMEKMNNFSWAPVTPSVPLQRLILSFLLHKNFGILRISHDFEII